MEKIILWRLSSINEIIVTCLQNVATRNFSAPPAAWVVFCWWERWAPGLPRLAQGWAVWLLEVVVNLDQ